MVPETTNRLGRMPQEPKQVSDDDLMMSELRAAVRRHRQPPGVVAESAGPTPTDLRYEVIREVRRGGQGAVYEAIQLATGRRVALKLLLRGTYSSNSQRRRFEREIDLLSSLSHPNVVTLYDSGLMGDQLFYAMEFIDGTPLSETDTFLPPSSPGPGVARKHISRCVQFFQRLCDAVAYCQQRGMIHRDLKPGNIMVRDNEDPVLVDFGLARDVSSADEDMTATGDFIGTPAYAAPEQVIGDPGAVDMRTDVYSLGAILYELLTGRRPHAGSTGPAEYLKSVTTIRPQSPDALNPNVDRDLATIVMKALSGVPERRYQSAAEFSADLKRRSQGMPIEARADSTWYVITRRLRRHRLQVAAAALFIATVAALSVVMFLLWRTAERQFRDARFQTYIASLYAADAATENHQILDALDSLNRPAEELRGWEWDYLLSRINHSVRDYNFGEAGSHVAAYAVSPDRRYFAVLGTDHSLHIADLLNHSTPIASSGVPAATAAVFDMVNNRLIVAGDDDALYAFSLETQSRQRTEAKLPAACSALACSDEHNRIYAATGSRGAWDGQLIILEGSDFDVVSVTDVGATPEALTVSPDGNLLAEASDSIRIRDALTGTVRNEFSLVHSPQQGDTDSAPERPVCLAFSDDGSLLAVGGHLGDCVIFDLRVPNQQPVTLSGHTDRVASVAFSTDGALLATACYDGLTRVYRTADGTLLRELHGHIGRVTGVTFSSDNQSIFASGSRNSVKEFLPQTPIEDRQIRCHESAVTDLEYSPRGDRIASVSADNQLRIISTETGEILQSPDGHSDTINAVAWCRDSKSLVTGGQDRDLRYWHVDNDTSVVIAGCDSSLLDVTVSPGSKHVAVGCEDGTVAVFPLHPSAEPVFSTRLPEPVRSVQYSLDGLSLTACITREIAVMSAADGKVIRKFSKEPYHYYSASAVHPQTGLLAIPDNTSAIVSWDVRSGTSKGRWGWHQMPVTGVEFHPDGSRLVSVAGDGSIRIWHSENFSQLLNLKNDRSHFLCVDWSPDGRTIAAGRYDGTVTLYEAIPPDIRLTR